MGIGHENYIELIERVTLIEAAQKHADEQRATMAADIKETKDLLAKLVKAAEIKDARFGGILWAAAAMATFLSTTAKLIWDWFNRGV